MCLRNPTTEKPKIASKDIACYKFLRVRRMCFDPDDGAMFISAPYRTHFRYELGEVTRLHDSIQLHRDSCGNVAEGFHSFKSWKLALQLAEQGNGYDRTVVSQREYFVFVCLIPKGAKYFLGKFAGYDSYASEALIVLDRSDPRALKRITNLPHYSKVKL